ncbi:MAG: RluA family pseudouridine synthase [Prolixibacteraceae bacterium]|nr:RluA family pseudouridine synthase [Prolixibacteraceae bacterium]MBT6763944.1 RluA family pseudouridine synthase [Prolixibacteraceae bacterium]MBT7396270.1 RluA family pseudouridine synthase [Prolixibacteraceae bacterium]
MNKKVNREIKKSTAKNINISLHVTENVGLMNFLIAKMPNNSRNKIKSLLGNKQVLVDGQVISQFNHGLVPGQKIEISKNRVEPEKRSREFTIVFEDNDLVVIEKQAGLLSISTEKEKRYTAYSLLSDHVKKQDINNKIFIVHRLDRETSGLMLFAKNEEVKRRLQDSWNDTVIERSYIAVVEGRFEKQEGVITSYLVEGKTFKVHSSQDPKRGKKAVTNYKVLKKSKDYSLLKVNLETGRKNQIRVHMQDLGHSVIGDKKYGANGSPIKRLGLHAQQLLFIHPITGKKMEFETKIPVAFLRLF